MELRAARRDESGIGHTMSNIYGIIDKILTFLPMKTINRCARLNSTWYNSVQRQKQKRISIISTLYFININKIEFKQKFQDDLEELWINPCCVLLFFTVGNCSDFEWKYFKPLLSYLPNGCASIPLQTYGIIGDSCHQSKRRNLSLKCESIILPKTSSFSAITFFIFEDALPQNPAKLGFTENDVILNTSGEVIYGNKSVLESVKFFLVSFDKNYDADDSDDEEMGNMCDLIPRNLIVKYNALVAGYISFCPKIENLQPIAQGVAFCGNALTVSSNVLTSKKCTRSRIAHSLDLLKGHFVSKDEEISSCIASDNNTDINATGSSSIINKLETYNCSSSLNFGDVSNATDTSNIAASTATMNYSHPSSAASSSEINATHLSAANATLKQLRSSKELTFAFMISCISRPDVLKRDKGVHNLDLTVFKEKFPSIPVFGYLVGGEIGFDHVQQRGVLKHTVNPPTHLQHSFSTIFVLISIF